MYWGIDLGGTKIEGVVLDGDQRVLARRRVPTEAREGMTHIIGQIRVVIDILADEVKARPERLGMGTPGSIEPSTGLLLGSNTQEINHQPFLAEVSRALGISVSIANDANCFALAEARLGVVRDRFPDARVVFGVIMGTGVGGGIVVDGRVLDGRHGIAGEWGHTFLDDSGGPCYCGDHGCVERLLSGPPLEKFYADLAGTPLALSEIAERAREGVDVHAVRTMARLVEFFGKGLANVINILDPDVIVLGGGLGNLEVLYDEGIEAVRKHVFRPRFDTPIVRPTLGDSAGVFGAALLGSATGKVAPLAFENARPVAPDGRKGSA